MARSLSREGVQGVLDGMPKGPVGPPGELAALSSTPPAAAELAATLAVMAVWLFTMASSTQWST
jgi:hypothetical protein